VVTSSAKPAAQDITSPTAPSHPLGSADLRILRAWVQAEQHREAPSCEHPVPAPTEHDPGRTERCGACRSCRSHHQAIVSAVVSAIDDSQDRRVTRATLTDLFDLIPAHLRPFFGLPSGEGLKRLLGRWDKRGVFQPAAVGAASQLTEDEAKVYWWHIRGWSDEEIQRELTAKGLRGNRALWVDADVVAALLEGAKAKVCGMFGVA